MRQVKSIEWGWGTEKRTLKIGWERQFQKLYQSAAGFRKSCRFDGVPTRR